MDHFNKTAELALSYHQFFYEHLPDWFQYKPEDRDYIKQRIGFTLYGIPECNTDERLIDNQATDFSTLNYDMEKRKMINNISEKILEFSIQGKNDCSGSFIYVGIIYNIAFNQKVSNSTSTEIYALPIFKIKANGITVWYIDNNGRVYKSWEDYLNNNTLPKCMMVIPVDGVYQCNPHCTVTKRSSTVWTHMVESPACRVGKKVANAIDIGSSVTSVTAAAGIGIAAMFTPIGPILTAVGLTSSLLAGGWNIGRSIEKLVDRSTHEESIRPSKGDALSAWFGITSSVLAIGASGGTMLLSRAISKGASISNAAKIAFNSVQIGNFTVSGFGIVIQGCRLIDQYQTKKEVDIFDMVMFTSQVLFFSNSLVNMKLANELISTSNGTILEKFKNMLRFERLEQQYNKIIGGESNHKRIIHKLTRIGNVNDFLHNHNIRLSFVNGKIQLNGISLIDPYLAAEQLLTSGAMIIANREKGSLLTKKIVTKLKKLFRQLLQEFISKQPSTSSSTSNKQSDDFNQLLGVFNELAEINNCTELLKIIFKIGMRLLLGEVSPMELMQNAILFVWEYSKANLRQNDKENYSLQGSSFLYDLLTKIITNLGDAIEQLVDDMYLAFHLYVSRRNEMRYLNSN